MQSLFAFPSLLGCNLAPRTPAKHSELAPAVLPLLIQRSSAPILLLSIISSDALLRVIS